ncbi:hypothetical protein [Streptomyces mangrovisoli]|uniref:Uncharacterized protein n=1 Tax=Streptomyces mangrovisoli TaxID=1428628 RepID=A0A1J4NQ86_9ACTN|nr:hypothetical protein [Streptomyces mangrovisoli]OIJ63326.1 hypothetical protein WN71_034780 [Streptomyces mangrovisoli]
MRALATRPHRLALGVAVLTAAALGTVGVSAAQAAGPASANGSGKATKVIAGATVVKEKGKGGDTAGLPPKGVGIGVAYKPTAHAPGDVNTASTRFATCMRSKGQKGFPDIHASGSGKRIRLQVRVGAQKGSDLNSASYKKAVKVCAPILAKAGVTFTSGSGLPPLPKPGEPGKSGKASGSSREAPSLDKVESGTGVGQDDGGPGLTTSGFGA